MIDKIFIPEYPDVSFRHSSQSPPREEYTRDIEEENDLLCFLLYFHKTKRNEKDLVIDTLPTVYTEVITIIIQRL